MLRYIISSEGIRVSLDKTKAIMSMVEPSTRKKVQKLTGRIAVSSPNQQNVAYHSSRL
jgi:hypothetical protein